MRTWGIVLMAVACLLTSFQILLIRRERIRALGDLAAALRLLQGELSLRGESLPRLFETIAGRCSGVGRELFEAVSRESGRLGEERFERIWRECVDGVACILRQQERERLGRVGEVLGHVELDLQLQVLEETTTALRLEMEQEEARLPEERRLYLGLGAAAAATLGIVLL